MNRGINASAGGGSRVFVVIILFVLLDGGLSPTSLCRVGSGGAGGSRGRLFSQSVHGPLLS